MIKKVTNDSKITKYYDFKEELISKVMIFVLIVGDTAVFAKMFLEQVSRKYRVRILNPKNWVCSVVNLLLSSV